MWHGDIKSLSEKSRRPQQTLVFTLLLLPNLSVLRPSLECVTNSGRLVADLGRLVAISRRFVSSSQYRGRKREKRRNFLTNSRLGLEHTTQQREEKSAGAPPIAIADH